MQSAVFAPDDIVVAARVDTRPRWRRLVGPGLTAAGALAGCVTLVVLDPNEPGHYPVCPMRLLFGIDCPACGVLRGTHDLLVGDVGGAADHNILVFVVVPLALVLLGRWFVRAWRGTQPSVSYAQFRRGNRVMIVALVLVLAFGVVRNFVPYLSSSA